MNCNCLTQYDTALPHYVSCDAAGGAGFDSAARALAEIASYRDLDTALSCLHELGRKGIR